MFDEFFCLTLVPFSCHQIICSNLLKFVMFVALDAHNAFLDVFSCCLSVIGRPKINHSATISKGKIVNI